MKISILCSDEKHPVVSHLQGWVRDGATRGHDIRLVHDKSGLTDGDILFLVSCTQLIRPDVRARFKATLVLHASDLPEGRGWSPHIWSVLRGGTGFTVTLLEAAEPVDSGAIWLKTTCSLEGHELLPEIEAKLFAAELSLMTQAVEKFQAIRPVPQAGEPGQSLPRRTPADSRLDVNKTLAEQFDLLRVVDAQRFPAFFEHRGHRYVLKIEKTSP
ncbi:MAG TPA: formyltransferase family protein [Opitutaceae bacterium]|nr:formyltransferase family protein [Opitutaceae bacterium]